MEKGTTPKTPAALRRTAKKKLMDQPRRLSELSGKDKTRLISELGTHQIELEMQNEELRRSQLELEQSRDIFAELYDYAPVGYFTLDSRGLIRDVNRTGAELLGLDKRRLSGRSFAGFLPDPEDQRLFREHCRDVFLKQTRQVCEVRLQRDKALPHYVRLQSIAARNIDGMIRMTVMDITDRRLAEESLIESEHRFRSLFNGMTEGFALLEVLSDKQRRPFDFRCLEVNPAFELLTGLKRSDVIGKTHREVLPEDASFFKTYSEVARTGQPVHFDRWSPALKRHYDVYAYSPEAGRVALLFLDITERKKAESELRESEERLKKTNAELEVINKELESFSFAVANDLKTPLRSIEGFSRAILEDYADLLGGTGKDYCLRIQAATQRMTQLIEAMWSMSRLTRGELAEHVVDLSAAAHVIARELGKKESGRQVSFIIAEGVTAKGDTDMMQVALENLFHNAWKFTSRHPAAAIEFGATERDGKTVYFVRDDGAGFDMAFADRLFRPFQRLHTDSEFPGIGIGLAIAHAIIKRHGGRMWAEGTVEKGATFYFTL